MAVEVTPLTMKVPESYDYTKSTEDNYRIQDPIFVGKYAEFRQKLDYSYHKYYSPERQKLQDQLIDMFSSTCIKDRFGAMCERPADDSNWIVFTAGCMGVGKGHVMRWLDKLELFPLGSFVIVDPDSVREKLPEFAEYNRIDSATAGFLTQKEVGHISELLTLSSLYSGKNVLVDGSFRDSKWYADYLADLKGKFVSLRIGIIHVTAKIETILARVKKRALLVGRDVPTEVVLDSLQKIPDSIRKLANFMDFYACFDNDNERGDPICKRLWIKTRATRSLSCDLRISSVRMNPVRAADRVSLLLEAAEPEKQSPIAAQHAIGIASNAPTARDECDIHNFSPQQQQHHHHQHPPPSNPHLIHQQHSIGLNLPSELIFQELFNATDEELRHDESTPDKATLQFPNQIGRISEKYETTVGLPDWKIEFAEAFQQNCALSYDIIEEVDNNDDTVAVNNNPSTKYCQGKQDTPTTHSNTNSNINEVEHVEPKNEIDGLVNDIRYGVPSSVCCVIS